MSKRNSLVQPRTKGVTVHLAPDEKEFFQSMADELGVGIAAVIRNAAIATLMPSNNPLMTAHEQHVTSLAQVDKWRRNCAAAAQRPPAPPRAPQPMR